MPVATAAFKDSAAPKLGMDTGFVIKDFKGALIPLDSFPIIKKPSVGMRVS
jgi:hypothetical protein